MCLRIEDVLVANEETAEEVFKKTNNLLEKFSPILSIFCPTFCIDRAYHIGPDYMCYKSQKKCYSILLCFISFKHQTLFYKKRASLKNVRVKIDFTKRRHEVSKMSLL